MVGCKGYRVINSERELQRAVAFKGPISLAIDSNQRNFQVRHHSKLYIITNYLCITHQLYKRGVYFEPICSVTKYNHAVLVVGYGDDHGTPYWLIKNRCIVAHNYNIILVLPSHSIAGAKSGVSKVMP